MPARPALLRLALLALLIAGAFWLAARAGLLELRDRGRLAEVVRTVRATPWAAPAFVGAYAAATTVGLPGLPFTLAGGALFGVALGTLLNWVAATTGAVGAYVLARLLGASAVRSLLGKHGATLDRFSARSGFGTLLRLRLIPVVPFNALNYAAGLAGMRPRAYLAATALGILPGTAVYTYFADSLLAGAAGAGERAFLHVAIAGTLLILLSFTPALVRRLRPLGRDAGGDEPRAPAG